MRFFDKKILYLRIFIYLCRCKFLSYEEIEHLSIFVASTASGNEYLTDLIVRAEIYSFIPEFFTNFAHRNSLLSSDC